jgi:lysophospholipase L1-like esterase
MPLSDSSSSRAQLFSTLVVTMGLGFVACSPGPERSGPVDAAPSLAPSVAPAPSAIVTPALSASVAIIEPASSAVAPLPDPSPPPAPLGPPELTRFQAALREIEQGTRKSHVRIAWLGDSHGQADFWTGSLRDVLQKRFGKGGPGFVHIGWKNYRHDGVKVSVEQKWKVKPKTPTAPSKSEDGVFGLGGILTSGFAGLSRAYVQVSDEQLEGKLSWDLCYRLHSANEQFLVTLDSGTKQTIGNAKNGALNQVQHLVLSSATRDRITVSPTRGTPDFCGVVIERDPAEKVGVVVDTLGINGARLSTPLGWDEASFGAEFSRRNPSLVVLEYGTNESGDATVDPAKYTKRIVQLMERMRKFVPDVDCVVVGPTDRSETRERTPKVRDAMQKGAQEAKCFFWDTYAYMGGDGSIRKWANEDHPRATKDGIHLTQRGYRELGEALAKQLLEGFSK